MRCPKCYTETTNEALCCPGCKLPTPRGRIYLKTRGKPAGGTGEKPNGVRPARRSSRPKDKKGVSPLIAVPVLLFGMLVFGLGSYVALTYWQESQASDSGSLEMVMSRVRGLPSSQSGKTIDEYLNQKVRDSQDAGRLLESEGWNVNQLVGNLFLVTFTYEENGNLHFRAEWEVNLASNTVIPKNDLAAKVYRQD